ncbi:histone H2B.1-like [Carcharodon carcharias]|uniref:histone H2B.1-like n=1 Tax=Carcharodon carcharias TaxID=13397 RepID=UPI001B7E84F6|nr:histone H2B.1-like [Carcharodon carcharias]
MASQVSSHDVVRRTWLRCCKWFNDLLRSGREKTAHNKAERLWTGGGQPHLLIITRYEQEALELERRHVSRSTSHETSSQEGSQESLKETSSKGRLEAAKVEEGELLHLQIDEAGSPDTGISSKAMSIVNSFVNDFFERIAGEASCLAHYNKRSAIAPRRSRPPGACCCLGNWPSMPCQKGQKVVTKYTSSK